MAVILIYDWDFNHYPSVLPNLECAKYAAYQKRKRNIAVFHNQFEPERYTHTFFRKEYDDGIYDNKILLPSVEYGGRAFSQIYKPYDMEMEMIEPDLSIYEKYKMSFGTGKKVQENFKTILYATHVRLSLDGKSLIDFPYERLRPRHPSVIFHDYDIASVPGAFELLQDISSRRPSGLPYRIGNKYPINVYSYQDLKKWLQLPPMGSCFYLQYNGVLTDEEIIDLLEVPIMGLRQMVYNFSYGYTNEEDFVIKALPQIYRQVLFLRSHKQKILLNIDTDFFQTRELQLLMKLIDCYYGKSYNEFIAPQKETMYGYCAWRRRAYLEVQPWIHFKVSQQEMREAFQYIRRHNYEVFDMFYSTPNVIAKGGKLVNEWERNS